MANVSLQIDPHGTAILESCHNHLQPLGSHLALAPCILTLYEVVWCSSHSGVSSGGLNWLAEGLVPNPPWLSSLIRFESMLRAATQMLLLLLSTESLTFCLLRPLVIGVFASS
mmetsp:Transcript_122458/g.305772  ORF Transcript_122458/g.305772 Transcript_122458/m.305772 type:complete len:113 (-) Transcript_122458:73-411(-)